MSSNAKLCASLALSLGLLVAFPARAELVKIPLFPGDEDLLITRDTESGLDWLNLTQTRATDPKGSAPTVSVILNGGADG